MAYALLADLPPIYGLYTCIVPVFAYGILGTSRCAHIGPFALGIETISCSFFSEYAGLQHSESSGSRKWYGDLYQCRSVLVLHGWMLVDVVGHLSAGYHHFSAFRNGCMFVMNSYTY